MSESSPEPSRHSPGDSATPAKGGAPKNKQCPFCGENFTSSSLGRHLDLYIKAKNPKAADGIHDVDKIRQIRANITRRQPRRSTQKTDASTPASNGPFPPGAAGSTYGFVLGTDQHKRILINRPTWEATGVMTDIPSGGLRFDAGSRKRPSRSEAAVRKRMVEDRTRLRAAELALQEVLDSVNAAHVHAHQPSPFDFDYFSQTFPALCLRMLPRQPTLSAAQVIENSKCCPIGPPGKAQYDLLLKALNKTLEEFSRSQAQAHERRDLHDLLSPNDSLKTSLFEAPDSSAYKTHLGQAFDVWKATPDSQRTSLWHLETLRAYSAAHDETSDLRTQLSKADTQMAHLRLQIARLSECQQPKEYTYNIPAHHAISASTVKGLADSKADLPLDREDLIKKWLEVVKDDTRYQRALPELELADLEVPDEEGMMDVEQNFAGAGDGAGEENGSMAGGEGGEGDSADAAGEDDDDDNDDDENNDVASAPQRTNGVNGAGGGTAAPTAAMGGGAAKAVKVGGAAIDQSVLDPSLREDGDGDEDGAMEVDKGDFGAEMLLADMKARARAGK